MKDPASKADVLENINETWPAYRAAAFSVDGPAAETPGPDGWSVKDHLIHVSAWERGVAAILRRESRPAAMGVDEAFFRASDADAINAVIHERTRDVSLADARRQADEAHADLMAAIDSRTWEELNQPASTYDSIERDEDYPVGALVAGNTYGHYPEHTEWLQRTIDAVKAG